MSGLDTRAIGVDDLPKKRFPQVRYQFRIHVSEAAFDRITSQGEEDLSCEVGGVLVGTVCHDDGGAYVRVESTINALHAEEKETELTFTHATWEHIHNEMDSRHKGQRIVGWYHTHPGFGVFLSDRDQFIHQSFFNLPHQIALVYDPKSREHGVFAWHENEPRRCRRYWVGANEHLWDGSRQVQAKLASSPDSEKVQMKQETEGSEEEAGRSMDVAGLGLFGVALLVVGGVLGWWIGQRGFADLAIDAEMKIAKARQVGTQEAFRMVNLELVDSLRKILSSDNVRVSLDEGLAAIDEGLADLASGDTDGSIAALRGGRRRLVQLRNQYFRAERMLAVLEQNSRYSAASARDTARSLALQSAAIGQLFQEIAEDSVRAGDLQRAQRLLQAAIQLDPDGVQRYRRRLDMLLGRPPETAKPEGKPHEEIAP